MSKPRIILASQSIGRKQLLEKLGLLFEVIPSSIDETAITHPAPKTRLLNRARAKAENVASFLSKDERRKTNDFLVIAADSEAVLHGKTYGKAKHKTHAKTMLKELMGQTHEFVTATSIILSDLNNPSNLVQKRWDAVTSARVTMNQLTPAELDEYLSRYDFSRFAAGYTLNETPWDLITKIEGSYTGVIGLPFEVVLPVLRDLKLI